MVDQDAVSSHLLAKKPGNKDVRVKSKTSVNTPSYHYQDEIGYENTIHCSVYKPTIVASTIVSAPKDVPILVYSYYPLVGIKGEEGHLRQADGIALLVVYCTMKR